jgi:hypothetical protein
MMEYWFEKKQQLKLEVVAHGFSSFEPITPLFQHGDPLAGGSSEVRTIAEPLEILRINSAELSSKI